MTTLERVATIKEKIDNNKDAVKTRHTYTGGAIDIKQDILDITSKPLGQCVTYLRRPYELTLTTENPTWWTNVNENTVLNNGSSPLSTTRVFEEDYKFYIKDKDGEVIYTITPYETGSSTTETIVRWAGLLNEFTIEFIAHGYGNDDFLNLKFSYGDFTPKNNCITEIIIEYSRVKGGQYYYYNTINFHKIFVRYENP